MQYIYIFKKRFTQIHKPTAHGIIYWLDDQWTDDFTLFAEKKSTTKNWSPCIFQITGLKSSRLLKLPQHINDREPAALRLCKLQSVVLLQKEERAWPVHFSNWLTDGKSLLFGLVSDQAAINQRPEEREACSEGRRREDKRSEWTDRINSWPRGLALRLARGVMKRCHLHRCRRKIEASWWRCPQMVGHRVCRVT